jgi:hypothetical protein
MAFSGMSADAGGGSEPAGIGTAEHADVAVVAGKFFTSQSMVSKASVDSSTPFGSFGFTAAG